MARQLRIEFQGAFYHVYSRGNQKSVVFFEDADRYYFLKCLDEAHRRFDCVVHALCLMTNHYHLFLETRRGNLSRIMQFINTTYSVYFNLKHKKCGHLFQGRYKAILVEAEAYACELARYIHLNPVRAGIVARPEDSSWSNYREYVGLARPRPWMETSVVLASFGGMTPLSRSGYALFVLSAISDKSSGGLPEADPVGILGSKEFVDRVKKEILMSGLPGVDRDLPQLDKLKRDPDLEAICAITESLLGSRNRFSKKAAIFISHRNTGHTLRTISDFYQMSISGVSACYRKFGEELARNETMSRTIEEIERKLFEVD
ncbi:MAG: transposase [Candidatus Aminicenantes bacterium]